ncbi:MAG: type II TA system antitoxin MqsA family protein [Desulfococcaceae bacterium]
MKCLTCNQSEMICKKVKYLYEESGLDNIYLEDTDVYLCPCCNEEIVSIHNIPELHDLIGKALTEKKSMLTGKEIRFLRKNAGLSAKKFARMIGVDNATLCRWENGEQNHTSPNDKLIRLVYSGIKGLPTRHLITDEFENIKSVQEAVLFNIPVQVRISVQKNIKT